MACELCHAEGVAVGGSAAGSAGGGAVYQDTTLYALGYQWTGMSSSAL